MTAAIKKSKVYTKSSLLKEDHVTTKTAHIPAANIDENEVEYIISIAAPGFNREDFAIDIEQDLLSVTARKEFVDGDCIHDRCEYDFSSWKRNFTLPTDADDLLARAKYKNGVLVIRIPRGKTDSSFFTHKVYVY